MDIKYLCLYYILCQTVVGIVKTRHLLTCIDLSEWPIFSVQELHISTCKALFSSSCSVVFTRFICRNSVYCLTYTNYDKYQNKPYQYYEQSIIL